MHLVMPQCQNLQEQVETILQLLHQEASLRSQQDITPIQASLRKVISPKFEIVFAGAFSAGKSMLINALLERELLYSAEGHATGTECYIEYAEPNNEQVVLTFLSEAEIRQQALVLCEKLGLTTAVNINQQETIEMLRRGCELIIQKEGGESKSETAKQAKALILLLEGYTANRNRIETVNNATYSMEQFNFSNLQEAASYARRGSNSAVLKRIDYYCYHPLLKDGNVLIDTPGIDAPVERDRKLTYEKISHPDTSAVVCVLKAASEGDMTTEETELLEKMRSNPNIRDRVFYIFNRIDETWYNTQLRQRLENLITSQFRDTTRVYKTSGLLGFWSSQIKATSSKDRFGLDSIFAESVKSNEIQEETPQFVYAFNNYCGTSRKLPSNFRISVNGYETPNENYVRILSEWGTILLEQIIKDSGIEEFRTAITKYLKEEKQPQLFANLADDLQPICMALQRLYQEQYRELDSQPKEIQGVKDKRLEQLNQDLVRLGDKFSEHISNEVNKIVTNECQNFEQYFRNLKVKVVAKMDELLNTFSIESAYRQAIKSHPNNSTAPLLAILVEAFYYLSNELEKVLALESQQLIDNLFTRLTDKIRHQDYYRELGNIIGNDAGIEQILQQVQTQIQHSIRSATSTECDRYLRESPQFYDEGTFSIYQFRQILQQTSQRYDCTSMIDAEPAIRQLLKLDFEPKVKQTIYSTFPQTINQTIKTLLLPMAKQQQENILQQYNRARAHLEKNLQKEAQEQLARNQQQQAELQENINKYDRSINQINQCLEAFGLYRLQLPLFDSQSDNPEIIDTSVVTETVA